MHSKNANSLWLYSDIDNIHAILLTPERTLPNISAIKKRFKEIYNNYEVSRDILLKALDDFEIENKEYTDIISEWKGKALAEGAIINNERMKKILNIGKNRKIGSMFNRFFLENYDIRIHEEWRNKDFEAEFQFENFLDIKYEYDDNDYVDGASFIYYVGNKGSKKYSYANACRIRKVISLGNRLEYEELLPLMAVEFVRNSQYTVRPFPYKYLKEYIRQC